MLTNFLARHITAAFGKQLLFSMIGLLLLNTAVAPYVHANLPDSDKRAIYGDWLNYVSDSGSCKATISLPPGTNETPTPPSGDGPVNGDNYPAVIFKYGNGPRLSTGLPAGANISVEDFAKLILKFIAVGAGKSEADVITDEKVLAVVAWIFIEGGSIKTVGSYNALNNAKDPILNDLQPVYNHVYGDGNQHPAFRHIEQGVESNVRFIEKAHYSRLHAMLLDPTMTAQKFVDNFDNKSYGGATGQKSWAAGGYLDLFDQILKGMINSPAAKERNYSTPILGPDALAALRDMDIAEVRDAGGGLFPIDITATNTNFSGSGGDSGCDDQQSEQNPNQNLPTGTDQELARKILENSNIRPTSAAKSQLENIAAGSGPCPTVNNGSYVIKTALLQIILALGTNNTFSIASLHRGCTGSTVGSGSKSRHWAGAAVDISGSSGINGVTMPSFGAYNEVIMKFVNEVANLFPAGDYGMGLPNNKYIDGVKGKLKEGNKAFLDTPSTTGATGPHIHIQVPR